MVANDSGIFKIANVRRLPDENAYDDRLLKDVNKPFAEYVANGAASSSPKTPVVIGMPSMRPDSLRSGPVPRRTMLKRADFLRFGLTAGCAGCQWTANPIGQSRNHTEDCRSRIEDELAKTEEGQKRIQKAKDRIDTRVAEMKEGQTSAHEDRDDKEGEKQDKATANNVAQNPQDQQKKDEAAEDVNPDAQTQDIMPEDQDTPMNDESSVNLDNGNSNDI